MNTRTTEIKHTTPTGAPLDAWLCNKEEKYDRALDPSINKGGPRPQKTLLEIILEMENELNEFWSYPDEFYPTAVLRRGLHWKIKNLKRLCSV